jgi:hypothetical protein
MKKSKTCPCYDSFNSIHIKMVVLTLVLYIYIFYWSLYFLHRYDLIQRGWMRWVHVNEEPFYRVCKTFYKISGYKLCRLKRVSAAARLLRIVVSNPAGGMEVCTLQKLGWAKWATKKSYLTANYSTRDWIERYFLPMTTDVSKVAWAAAGTIHKTATLIYNVFINNPHLFMSNSFTCVFPWWLLHHRYCCVVSQLVYVYVVTVCYICSHVTSTVYYCVICVAVLHSY